VSCGDDGRVAFLRVPAQRRDRDRISARPSRPSPLSPSLPFPLSPSARGRARRTSAWRTSAGRRIGHLRGVGIAGACSWTLPSSAAGRAGGCDGWGARADSTRPARMSAFVILPDRKQAASIARRACQLLPAFGAGDTARSGQRVPLFWLQVATFCNFRLSPATLRRNSPENGTVPFFAGRRRFFWTVAAVSSGAIDSSSGSGSGVFGCGCAGREPRGQQDQLHVVRDAVGRRRRQ